MSPWTPRSLRWFAGPGPAGSPGFLLPRWLFLRALGGIYFSAFYSQAFQVRGLLGPEGLLPANLYLKQVAQFLGARRYWYAPTLLWLGSGDHALTAITGIGMIASILLCLNLWPRASLVVCFGMFLSFVAAAQDFSGYQSDGMLLSAGFISIFLAPYGARPGLGERQPPSRASLLLLQLVWFSIYFDSGIAKYFGGDPSWHNGTAMDQYYQNGPLPTWIGWYAQQLPHGFHAATTMFTLVVELLLVWMLFLPRRFRIVCCGIVTSLQVAIILTANYGFLNAIVLSLGILLVDDRFLVKLLPAHWARGARANLLSAAAGATDAPEEGAPALACRSATGLWTSGVILAWLLYANVFLVVAQVVPLPAEPVSLLEPFRIANRYGLFGRMTWKRYEIEFQGSSDGRTWVAYPFRNKPQDPAQAPRIYTPYQPRFDWNLWFASLDTWRDNTWVVRGEQQLLVNDRDVLSLFGANPFPEKPPRQVRAVLWQYWFTDLATKRATGLWWRRKYLGLYAPALGRGPDDAVVVTAWPESPPAPP